MSLAEIVVHHDDGSLYVWRHRDNQIDQYDNGSDYLCGNAPTITLDTATLAPLPHEHTPKTMHNLMAAHLGGVITDALADIAVVAAADEPPELVVLRVDDSVSLVCPHCNERDSVREIYTAQRINELDDLLICDAEILISWLIGDINEEFHERYECAACGRAVSLPLDVGDFCP